MPPQNQMPEANFQAEMPQKSSKAWMIIAILLGLLLIAESVFGYYKWQEYKKLAGSLGADVNSLNAQVAALNAQIATISKTAQSATSTSDSAAIVKSSEIYALATNSAVKSVAVTVTVQEGNAALVTVTPTPSQTNYSNIFALKKQNGVWVVVYTGTVKPTAAQASTLGLPNTTQFHQ